MSLDLHSDRSGSILADVAAILADFSGRDDADSIGPGIRLFADLALASIDAVVLGERLQTHYGQPLPFADLLAGLGAREDRDLVVGELVAFLDQHLPRA